MDFEDNAKLTNEERRQYEARLENEIFEAENLEFDRLVLEGMRKFWRNDEV